MRERVESGWHSPELHVYPFLETDAPDALMASAGYVGAKNYSPLPPAEPYPLTWGVEINMSGGGVPMTRERSDKLTAAIARCWEWIGEQTQPDASASALPATVE